MDAVGARACIVAVSINCFEMFDRIDLNMKNMVRVCLKRQGMSPFVLFSLRLFIGRLALLGPPAAGPPHPEGQDMSFANISIGRKLAAGFAAVVLIVVLMGGLVFQNLASISVATTANNTSTATLAAADSALSALVEQQNAVRGYAATGDKSFPPRVAGFQDDFHKAADKLDALATDDALRAQVQALREAADKVAQEEAGQIALRQDTARAAEVPASILTKGRLTEVRRILKGITGDQQALVTARSAQQAKALASAKLALEIGGGASVLLAVLLGWAITRAIAAPVPGHDRRHGPAGRRRQHLRRARTSAARTRSAGWPTPCRPSRTRRSRSCAWKPRPPSSGAQRGAAPERRGRARAAPPRSRPRWSTPWPSGLERLAAGDLTFRLTQAFPRPTRSCAPTSTRPSASCRRPCAAIAANASGIRTGSGEISQAADDLSRRTEQQAASLEETAAALDEITATVRKTAEGAGQAREWSSRAQADAERSGEVVREAVAAMSRDRDLRPADQPDHRRDRRDRLPDQPAGAERRRRGGPRRRRRPRLRGGRLRSARPGPALGRRGQGDQGPDLGLDRPGRAGRQPGRRDRRGAGADRRPGRARSTAWSPRSPARPRSRPPACSRSTPPSTRWTR